MPTFVDALAPDRFAKYRRWANGNDPLAHRLYAKNVEIAEAFYTPLHTVEIALRNVVDGALRPPFGDFWFDDPQVVRSWYMQNRVREARQKLASLGPNLSRGHIIAELSFGFWGGMFGSGQKRLWGPHLRAIFPASVPLQRTDIARRLDAIRGIRNRIAHHEPIIQLDLNAAYTEILELTEWISTDAADWTRRRSRFPSVCPQGLIIINNAVNQGLITQL